MKKLPFSPDKLLIISILSLLLFGILAVYDVSVVYASNVLGGKYYFLILQSIWVCIGLIGFLVGYKVDYHNLGRWALPLFIIAIVLIVFVILPTPFSPVIYGAHRWIYLNPEPFPKLPLLGRIGFQPSEFLKLGFVIYLSFMLSRAKKLSPLSFAILLGAIVLLVLRQPDMGTAILISAIGIVVFFISGVNILYFALGIPVAIAGFLLLILSSPYRRDRLMTYLNHKPSDDTFLYGAGYHINQILIALGSGGFFGVGFGQSRQKYQYIPEPATDSIFAILGEELGFLGSVVIVSVFLFIIIRGFKIARTAPDGLGRLLATGITSWFAVQCLINLAAMTRIIPLTGVPLPLISYGGSSMIFLLMGLGILLNISKQCENI